MIERFLALWRAAAAWFMQRQSVAIFRSHEFEVGEKVKVEDRIYIVVSIDSPTLITVQYASVFSAIRAAIGRVIWR